MPVHKCPNGKWRIGSGKCQYDSKEKAERAYRAYLAQKHSDKSNEVLTRILEERIKIREEILSVKHAIIIHILNKMKIGQELTEEEYSIYSRYKDDK